MEITSASVPSPAAGEAARRWPDFAAPLQGRARTGRPPSVAGDGHARGARGHARSGPRGACNQAGAGLVPVHRDWPDLAHVLVGEVFHREFGNRRELAAYFGLAPSHHSSGTVHRDQGIAKSGYARARSIISDARYQQ